MIGYALCGSFCTWNDSYKQMMKLVADGYPLQPIMSEIAYTTDTRFGKAKEWIERIEQLCDREIIHTIPTAEPLGPKSPLELLIIAPCTGNTLAKLANGITDSPVCMAAKAHLRTDRPLIIALASNDAMSANLKNIGALLTRQSVYFVPVRQDDPIGKPHSLVADFEQIPFAIEKAKEGKQIRPLFLNK
jgi:dipicolinate synthase subunit B